jgi:type III restriction enzyme
LDKRTDEFIAEGDINLLPPKFKKGVQEAIALFKFLEGKSDVSFAPVFTPLLGPIDEAARSFIISALKDAVPQGQNLRRTLVDNDGIMPMGLLRWCLEYAKSPRTPPGGIFNAVKIKFEAAAKTNLPDTVERIYSFRNEFIAHQEKELTDLDVAKQAMIDWIGSLRESFAASKDNFDMEAA